MIVDRLLSKPYLIVSVAMSSCFSSRICYSACWRHQLQSFNRLCRWNSSVLRSATAPTSVTVPVDAHFKCLCSWNSSVPSFATAPAYVAVHVVATKTSSAVTAPASVAMPAVVQVSIHLHYLLLLVRVSIDYHYLLRLLLVAIHLHGVLLLVQVKIHHHYLLLLVQASNVNT